MARVLIVANKSWEADPLTEFLSSKPGTDLAQTPFVRGGDDEPRWMRGRFVDRTAGDRRVEVLCLQDAITKGNASSSALKAEVLPKMVACFDDTRLIVAFGTAATYGQKSFNGSVVAGTCVFMHDPSSRHTESHWQIPVGQADAILESALSPNDFANIFAGPNDTPRFLANALPPPNDAAPQLGISADYAAVAVSEINVTNYADYAWSDYATSAEFMRLHPGTPIGSFETTHGVIRSCAGETPFAFVSGIVDRVGHFAVVGARNAGVAVALFVPRLLDWLAAGPA